MVVWCTSPAVLLRTSLRVDKNKHSFRRRYTRPINGTSRDNCRNLNRTTQPNLTRRANKKQQLCSGHLHSPTRHKSHVIKIKTVGEGERLTRQPFQCCALQSVSSSGYPSFLFLSRPSFLEKSVFLSDAIPPPEREKMCFITYLCALTKQPPSDCPPVLLPSPNTK